MYFYEDFHCHEYEIEEQSQVNSTYMCSVGELSKQTNEHLINFTELSATAHTSHVHGFFL